MAEQKILYNGRFVKDSLMSKTEHDEQAYEVTIIGYDTNVEGSIVYNQYLKWVTKKVARMCGLIEATDSLTGKDLHVY